MEGRRTAEDGVVGAVARRRPSRPLGTWGSLVSPDRSVGLGWFNRRVVRQVGEPLFAGITTLPLAGRPLRWALPRRFALCKACGEEKTMGQNCRAEAPFFSNFASGSTQPVTRFLGTK